VSAHLPRIDSYRAADGHRLSVRIWDAHERPTARIVFVHGVTSHGGWYEHSAEFLANAGFEVAFLDRRGSGLNGEAMGDIDHWQTWLADIAAFITSSKATDGESSSERARVPTFLCGISWGGKLAAAAVRRYPWLFKGLALICPGIHSPFMPGVWKRAVLQTLSMDRLQPRRLRIPLRDPELFTATPRWQQFIANDPLSLRTITWRFARQDVGLTRYARDSASFIHMPVLLMLGGQDRIVDNRRTRDFFGNIAGHHKTLIEYPGAGHTLEFEPDPTSYFHDLAGWFNRTAAGIEN
jgi:alpha-beta hydrolase superfamily lysophospholipase